jgi:hypothetical protein
VTILLEKAKKFFKRLHGEFRSFYILRHSVKTILITLKRKQMISLQLGTFCVFHVDFFFYNKQVGRT